MSHMNISRRPFSDEVRRYRETIAVMEAKQLETMVPGAFETNVDGDDYMIIPETSE